MNKNLLISLVVSSIAFPSVSSAADEKSINIGITSDYLWRGVTQSDNKFSLSAGGDYNDNSGFYVGVWAASVDFDDNTNFEYDFYTGFQKEINNINFDIGYIRYGYQGEDNLDFSEVYIKANYKDLTFAISTLVDSDTGGDFSDSTYIEVNYDYSLTNQITMSVHGGYYDFKDSENYQDFNLSFGYEDFSLMISTLTGNDNLEDTVIALSYAKAFSF